MNLTAQQQKEYNKVSQYVEHYAKVWFFEPKKCYNAAITCYTDMQEYGSTPEDCKAKLTNRVFGFPAARNYIINEWQKL